MKKKLRYYTFKFGTIGESLPEAIQDLIDSIKEDGIEDTFMITERSYSHREESDDEYDLWKEN